MKNIILTLTSLSVILLFNSSCNESTLLGADLFVKENLDLVFTDSLTINALSETNDSIIVSSSGNSFINLPIGKVKDATFGTYSANAYTELDSASTYAFSSGRIDSVVFVMGYNADGIYGDTNQMQKLSLYRLTENMKKTGNVYSNQKYTVESAPLGSIDFKPQPRTFINQNKGLTTLVDTAPQIRIKITDASFIQQLGDVKNFSSTDGNKEVFRKWLKGLEIRAEKETSCMLNMDFGSATTTFTGLYVYSKKDTTSSVSYFRSVSSANAKHCYFNNNYKNAPIEPFLNNQKMSDSLLFIQGMSGTNIRLEIPYIRNLGKIVINKAELELTLKEDGTQLDMFPYVNQILARNAIQEVISDVVDGDATSRAAKFAVSGGYVKVKTENGEKRSKYIFSISNHLQNMLDGKEGSQLYLVPFFKQENAARVVLYGLKSKYRAKINITYTKIP
jgi:hypothetical protein